MRWAKCRTHVETRWGSLCQIQLATLGAKLSYPTALRVDPCSFIPARASNACLRAHSLSLLVTHLMRCEMVRSPMSGWKGMGGRCGVGESTNVTSSLASDSKAKSKSLSVESSARRINSDGERWMEERGCWISGGGRWVSASRLHSALSVGGESLHHRDRAGITRVEQTQYEQRGENLCTQAHQYLGGHG